MIAYPTKQPADARIVACRGLPGDVQHRVDGSQLAGQRLLLDILHAKSGRLFDGLIVVMLDQSFQSFFLICIHYFFEFLTLLGKSTGCLLDDTTAVLNGTGERRAVLGERLLGEL